MKAQPAEVRAAARMAVDAIKQLSQGGPGADAAAIAEMRRLMEHIDTVATGRAVRDHARSVLSHAEKFFGDRGVSPERYVGTNLLRQVRLAGAIQRLEHALHDAGLLDRS